LVEGHTGALRFELFDPGDGFEQGLGPRTDLGAFCAARERLQGLPRFGELLLP
jgi:hypothetical protein